MPRTAAIVGAVLAALLANAASPAAALAAAAGPAARAQVLAPAVCFAPDSTPEQRAATERRLAARAASSLTTALSGARYSFADSWRWTWTATNGCCLSQGDPTTLTWSVVPDGTPVGGSIGEPASASDLRARLDRIYGSSAVWLPLLEQVFERWGELTGITYVHQPSDDGASFPGSGGLVGVRGDVRIAGHPIDGPSGVLAYNFYPNAGDMVLDTADTYYDVTTGGSLRLRNVLAHEHGHGLGLAHVCPIDRTKLMEPIAAVAYDGPQEDDVLAVHRGYGDDLEHNDAPENASDLGPLSEGTIDLADLSVDDDADVDLFQLTVAAGRKLSLQVSPVGHTYLQGPQSGGSCTAGTSFDARSQNDLAVDVLAPDGITPIATADATAAGAAETVTDLALSHGAGTYTLRVRGGSGAVSTAQLYALQVSIADAAARPDEIFADGFESGDLTAWSSASGDTGNLAVYASAALAGTMGAQATIDGRAPLFVTDRSPAGETRYRARMRIDTSGLQLAASSDRLHLFHAVSALPTSRILVVLPLRVRAGRPEIAARVRLDDGRMRSSAFVPLADGPQELELDWRQATAPGTDDGALTLSLDGAVAVTLEGLDNDQRSIDTARLGAVRIPAGASGALRFDEFRSWRRGPAGP